MQRIGIGYDIHRFRKARKLVLGGVIIPYDKGLDGHSDADCLIHAVCDALLGAAGLPDIGVQFPNTDIAFKNISSTVLLKKVKELLAKNRYAIGNVDTVIVAQEPKVAPYTRAMKANISKALGIGLSCVCVKATTPEGLGPLGAKKGIACWATAIIKKGAKS
ncbi:MAG: 2-C-methyl-D-erythritol 2,4-cyclodiphosphate synthase [Candidatus Omnitrophica bacterium]|nr:2-C-methyl-D-erythritol 2,4-cyclodiphosphate synthase [Candidatus Omnitrophota bacterium]